MSSDCYFTASTSRKHVTQVAEGSYHLHLIRSCLDFTLWSAVNRVGISHAHQSYNQDLVSVVASCISYAPKVRSHCSRCCCCLLYDRHRMGIHRSRPLPQIKTFVFTAFTPNPIFSMASFHIKSLLTHSSRESAMIIGSSAYRSSQGTPARNSCDKASSTMMKNKGLSMDP